MAYAATGFGQGRFASVKKPKAGEAAALPFAITANTVPATGAVLCAQGAAPSADLLDSGFVLAIKDLEPEADRVTATSVQLTLDICQTRTKAGVDPAPLSANAKVKVGRFVHEQDGNHHHGRAMLIVRQVKPKKFDGTVVLRSLPAAHTELFPNERPTAGEAKIAAPHEIDFKVTKNEDQRFFVQGKSASAALRDSGYFLNLKEDPLTNADTILMTVVKLTNLKADLPSTPPNAARAGNAAARRAVAPHGAATRRQGQDRRPDRSPPPRSRRTSPPTR